MKVGIMGTGEVGRQVAQRLAGLGHEVSVGSRAADNAEVAAWAEAAGVVYTTFAEAAAAGELIVNATGGLVSVAALTAAGQANLSGKVLLDISNPIDFSAGFPPKIPLAPGGVSIAEEIQHTFPDVRVVKSLNTIANAVMVEPGRVPGWHQIFVSGNDQEAKDAVAGLLGEFGWPADRILDLGDLTSARALEQYVGLWLQFSKALGTYDLNIEIHRAG